MQNGSIWCGSRLMPRTRLHGHGKCCMYVTTHTTHNVFISHSICDYLSYLCEMSLSLSTSCPYLYLFSYLIMLMQHMIRSMYDEDIMSKPWWLWKFDAFTWMIQARSTDTRGTKTTSKGWIMQWRQYGYTWSSCLYNPLLACLVRSKSVSFWTQDSVCSGILYKYVTCTPLG